MLLLALLSGFLPGKHKAAYMGMAKGIAACTILCTLLLDASLPL